MDQPPGIGHNSGSTQAYDGLPDLLIEIAVVAGLDVALTIARDRGGNRIYIPARAADDHWLVALVGRAATDALVAHFGGGIELDMPLGPVGARADGWRKMYQMIAEGRSSTEITRATRLSRDTVKYHRAKLRNAADNPQLNLMDLIE
jgi:hypothetical protein